MSTPLTTAFIEIPISTTEEQCKYCYDNLSESKHQFIRPCSCTDPICSKCFQTHVADGKTQCEICMTEFSIEINSADQRDYHLNISTRTVNQSNKFSTKNLCRIISYIYSFLFLCLLFILTIVPIALFVAYIYNGWSTMPYKFLCSATFMFTTLITSSIILFGIYTGLYHKILTAKFAYISIVSYTLFIMISHFLLFFFLFNATFESNLW